MGAARLRPVRARADVGHGFRRLGRHAASAEWPEPELAYSLAQRAGAGALPPRRRVRRATGPSRSIGFPPPGQFHHRRQYQISARRRETWRTREGTSIIRGSEAEWWVHRTMTELLAPDEPSPVRVLREDRALGSVPHRRSRRARDPAQPRHARPAGERTGAAYRLGHRHRRRHRAPVGGAGRHRRAADLFAPGDRLQPRSRGAKLDPEISEATEIPGNADLSAEQRAARRRAIFEPYHARIRGLLDARQAAAPAHGIHRDAQLHAGVQGRVARHAGRRAVQPRRAAGDRSCWNCCAPRAI